MVKAMSIEGKVFYWTVTADFLRYLLEFAKETSCALDEIFMLYLKAKQAALELRWESEVKAELNW